MKVVIEIPENEYELIKEFYEKNDIVESTYSYIYHGTPLDSIIADIEVARDKDKLCEYPYNRCIDILRRKTEQ